VLADRVVRFLEAVGQLLETLLPNRAVAAARIQGRRYGRDVFDAGPDRFLLGADLVESAVDAVGEPAKLLLGEPPFFSSKFLWSDSRTSPSASAIRRPGGCSGPPWSSLSTPRTAAQ
jgi:hypothetical protein